VSNCSGRTVDVVSEDGRDVMTLLNTTHGIHYPCALYYCETKDKLYLNSGSKGTPVSVINMS